MRLIDTILSLIILSIFIGFFSSIFISCERIYKETKIIESSYERDRFVCLGFKQICKETNNTILKSEIENFNNVCLKMWQLDSLSITDEKNIFTIKWKCNKKEMLVLIKK